MSNGTTTLEQIVSLCKRRGFVFQSAELYGGLNGIYDYGHLGYLMRENIKNAWRRAIRKAQPTILFTEGALLGPASVWKASGHLDNFNDPMVDCRVCKHRFRSDEIDLLRGCPHCGAKESWSDVRQFNMMFSTNAGASADHTSLAYLRPETAQTIFVNFKQLLTTGRMKLPFGIAQVGKSFRNEITPRQFLFRMREFEQMELEWFCAPEDAASFFEQWVKERVQFYHSIGIAAERVRIREHRSDELAHYSRRCVDVEYNFPFGWKELEGIADRGDFDLKSHAAHAKKDLQVYDQDRGVSYLPYVVECSVGLDRLFLTLMFDAYCTDVADGEQRVVLRLNPCIAPIKAAFLPLSDQQSSACQKMAHFMAERYEVQFDDAGSIGKRYRRQDEIGTPFCFTYDFQTAQDATVTVRYRDSMSQERIPVASIESFLAQHLVQALAPVNRVMGSRE